MEIFGHFQTSVRRALEEIDPQYSKLSGLIICGTHDPSNLPIDEMLDKIRAARELEIPFLGICFGHQLAAIEYARNVLGIKDATSEEFGVPGTFVVQKRANFKVGLHEGESYWSNYQVSLTQWDKPLHFVTTQYHPEYQSSKNKPHLFLEEFIDLCKK